MHLSVLESLCPVPVGIRSDRRCVFHDGVRLDILWYSKNWF